MARLPSQPEPVHGAAYYYAEGKNVIMLSDGHASCIQNCRSEGTALDAAKKWQEKENKAVTKESERLRKLGIAKLSDDGSPPPGYMQGRGAA